MARPRGSKRQRQQDVRKRNGSRIFIGYARVSTEAQEENGHSLDGQCARLWQTADREGVTLIDIAVEVASGRKERDGLREVQARIAEGEANGLVVAKIDRLGRSTIGLLKAVQWAETEGVDILSVAEGWIVRDGKVVDDMLTGRAWFAELEAKKISERTREGLAAAKAKGVQLGRPPLNTRLQDRATELRRQGATLQAIADTFNSEGHRTAKGRDFQAMTVYRMVNRVDPAANPEGGYPRVTALTGARRRSAKSGG